MTTAKARATELESSRVFRMLARFGFAVNGALHILIGVIAIRVALGARHEELDQSGALHQVASTPGGVIELWIAVIGLGSLGVWELIQSFVATGRGRTTKWMARLTALGRGVVYLALCVAVLLYTLGITHSSSRISHDISASVMSSPGGVILVGLIGLVILGIGVAFAFLGISGRFLKPIRVPRGKPGVAVVALGRVGYIGQGLVLAIVGVFFIVGAVTSDPSKAAGLDGALKALIELPLGEVLLALVAAGLIIYGVYCMVRARFEKL